MALPLAKTNPTTNASLDMLKLIGVLAEQCIVDVKASFFSNGNLSIEAGTKALKKIQGRMETLKAIVNNTN